MKEIQTVQYKIHLFRLYKTWKHNISDEEADIKCFVTGSSREAAARTV